VPREVLVELLVEVADEGVGPVAEGIDLAAGEQIGYRF